MNASNRLAPGKKRSGYLRLLSLLVPLVLLPSTVPMRMALAGSPATRTKLGSAGQSPSSVSSQPVPGSEQNPAPERTRRVAPQGLDQDPSKPPKQSQDTPKTQKQDQEPTKPQKQDQEEVLRLSSRLVVVPVSATDQEGRPVKDLTVDDFVIEEEGRPQRIVA